ncbi:MAG TPA: delta-60 repeat domain-containing protein [Candidatus Bathyarchaeia archaeon]|nr:delta-60 repeat domain-containing protein [Candidatus Bathyarchaeia archaeon]
MLIESRQAAAQAGQLDPTFGNGGIVTTDFGDQTGSNNAATGNAALIQPDGKIVVVGAVPGSNGFPVAAVLRYNTNGSLDTSFGSGGIVNTPSIEDEPFTSVALQADGKIVAVAGGFSAFVARYTTAGALDSTFGTGGIVQLAEINGTPACGVLIQPDGRILIADKDLFRLLTNGQFDTTFGSNGRVNNAGYPATALVLLPNGEIVTASSGGASGVLAQYQSNGTLDTTFGISGQAGTLGSTVGLVLPGSGDIVVGGALTNNSVIVPGSPGASSFLVSRYLPSGIGDGSFGTNGGTATPVPNYVTVNTSGLALEPTGDIVLAGTATQNSLGAFALTRYTPAGQLDTTFGNNGTVVTVFGGGFSAPSVHANGLTIQSDGKIIVVGSYVVSVPRHGFDTAIKVLRYLAS